MTTRVEDVMSSPAVTCDAGTSLAGAARRMEEAGTGSVVVTEGTKVAGILTERDLLRAASAAADPGGEPVRLWMTTGPDVLSPDEEASAGMGEPHPPPLPPPARGRPRRARGGGLDPRPARLGPAAAGGRARRRRPAGSRGRGGRRDLRRGRPRRGGLLPLPPVPGGGAGGAAVLRGRLAPAGRRGAPRPVGRRAVRPHGRRTARAPRGAGLHAPEPGHPRRAPRRPAHRGLGDRVPSWSGSPPSTSTRPRCACQALRLGAVVPTVLAAAHRLRRGEKPVPPRPDLGHAANYLWMLRGAEPDPAEARAVEQYLILVLDHGFNASTFTARVITSTGADLAAAVCGAVGALSGPLHGGAPSRALDMLDAIGDEPGGAGRTRAEAWIRAAVERGDRVMGFGHRVYKTDDPRSRFLHEVAGPSAARCSRSPTEVETTAVRVLAELKPGRRLYTNVEFYAGRRARPVRHPPGDVHPHLRRRPHRRLDHPRHGAGGREPAHSAGGTLRGSATARDRARAVGARRAPPPGSGPPRAIGSGLFLVAFSRPGPLAHREEQGTFNPKVPGSRPGRPTTHRPTTHRAARSENRLAHDGGHLPRTRSGS